jgi:hypothetical protein
MITTYTRMQTQAPTRARIVRSSAQSPPDTGTRVIRRSTQPQPDTHTRITAPTRIHERTP